MAGYGDGVPGEKEKFNSDSRGNLGNNIRNHCVNAV